MVTDFKVIAIGHLKYNPLWGETLDPPPRSVPYTCTCTYIEGQDDKGEIFRLLIDPTLRASRRDLDFDINRRTGLHLEDITHVFITHTHGDHIAGVTMLPHCQWLTSVGNCERFEQMGEPYTKMKGVEGEFLPGVTILPVPGHTPTLAGVSFTLRGYRIAVVGDGVMTESHFREEITMYQPDEAWQKVASESIAELKEKFDIVIPGHDDMILV